MTVDYVFLAPGELRVNDHICSPLGISMAVTSTPRPMPGGWHSVECTLTLHFYPSEVVKVHRHPAATYPVPDVDGVEVPY